MRAAFITHLQGCYFVTRIEVDLRDALTGTTEHQMLRQSAQKIRMHLVQAKVFEHHSVLRTAPRVLNHQ